ncbi:hypothetical protein CEV33_3205 [Brucella grignonensis]|uniref:Uncharacterized protein n=1 Tax=Brucella grignonensis TaxID=94627 RepID=A0A256F0Y9_9HYPH|nr:hypothetical protein CEV33_3205 [Brucella grignonensis]
MVEDAADVRRIFKVQHLQIRCCIKNPHDVSVIASANTP